MFEFFLKLFFVFQIVHVLKVCLNSKNITIFKHYSDFLRIFFIFSQEIYFQNNLYLPVYQVLLSLALQFGFRQWTFFHFSISLNLPVNIIPIFPFPFFISYFLFLLGSMICLQIRKLFLWNHVFYIQWTFLPKFVHFLKIHELFFNFDVF